jgi:hypothetical protein
MAEPPKTLAEWRAMTDELLIQEAQMGLRGLGAVVEMSRRLLLVAQQDTMRRLTWLILSCTAIMLITAWADIYLRHSVPVQINTLSVPMIPAVPPVAASTPTKKDLPEQNPLKQGGTNGTKR